MSDQKTLGTKDKVSDKPASSDSASRRSKAGGSAASSASKSGSKAGGQQASKPSSKSGSKAAAKKPRQDDAKPSTARSAAKAKPKSPAKTAGATKGANSNRPASAAKSEEKAAKPSKTAKSPKPQAAKPAILTTQDELTAHCAPWRKAGAKIALVPTMGALHDGHLALIRQAGSFAPHVIVSIFVNPTQFAAHEDLDRYPSDKDGDLAKLAKLGVDAVWMPAREIMYREGFATRIAMDGPALGLETDFRPHFFGGVATVVAKLFNQVRPDFAVFGEKDFQQMAVIRQLVSDLDLGVTIVTGATVRESDGLAMSSRNAYLSPKERAIAPRLNAVLTDLAGRAQAARDAGELPRMRAEAVMSLITKGFTKVDYVEVRDAETLGPFDPAVKRPGRILAAAWLGRTRLIDNVPVEN